MKKTKPEYFNNIDINIKTFWTTVKSFFTDISKICDNIILNEDDKTIKVGKEIANKYNKYFANIHQKAKPEERH